MLKNKSLNLTKVLFRGHAKLKIGLIFLVIAVFVANIIITPRSYALTDTFNSSGSWQAPAGVTSVTIEAWAGGGAGGAATGNPATGGGGAGGAFVSKVISVTPGNIYTVTVGDGGVGGAGSGGVSGDSWFDSSSVVLAKGGAGGVVGATNSSNGAGGTGSCSGCVGDTTFAGGNGGTGNFNSGVQGSGAGGGAAGSSGVGGNANVNAAGTGTSGGGNGADGVGNNSTGSAGNIPGGGGSGGKANNNADRNGGSGAAGRVLVTYTVTNGAPAAPVLSTPSSGATGVSTSPSFSLRSTDADNDYLMYKILLYQSDCSTLVSTIDQTSSQTGWSGQDTQGGTAYTGNSVISSSTMATHTYQAALSASTTYCWQAQTIDPGGTNSFGSLSSSQSFTTAAANAAPSAPTLSAPADTATSVSTTPNFSFRSSDADNDYLRYKIEVCSTSNCSVIVRTIDQTASQTGWSGQDTQGATAYIGNSTISSSTLASHAYQSPVLSNSTQYWWRAYAIDPAGTNTFGAVSAINSFTTEAAPPPPGDGDTLLRGGTHIRGGTRIGS